jgi:hypothetical protein
MALPKHNHPEYIGLLPISGKEFKYRPYTVKEEKILLLAKESDDPKDHILAAVQVMESCTDIQNARDLPTADVEYAMLKLRIVSVSDISQLRYRCVNPIDGKHCNGIIEHDLDLNQIELINPDTEDTITFSSGIGIKMRFPTFNDTFNFITGEAKEVDREFDMIFDSMVYVFDKEKVYPKEETSKEEFSAWLDDLRKDDLRQLYDFFKNIPYLYKEIELVCPKCGNSTKLELKGLSDFF